MASRLGLDETGLAVIDEMYCAALEPRRWGDVLSELAGLFRGDEATLELHDTLAGEVMFFDSVRADADAFRDYAEHFAAVNPRIPAIAGVPEGAFFCDYDFYSEREISNSEFYQDFLAPQQLKYLLSSVLVHDDRRLGVIAIHRSSQSGHAKDREADMLRTLTPHLQRALQLTARLGAAERMTSNLCEAMGNLALAVVLFDPRGRVSFVNEAALRVLHVGGTLELRDRELHARNPEDDRVLREAVHAAARGWAGRATVAVRDTLADQPHVVTLCPLPSIEARYGLFAGASEPTYAAMAVLGGSPSAITAASVLQRGYGLTRAEAKLATSLADGTSLRQYAEAKHVSFHTARAHLAHLRAKLDCRTQGDVIRKVLALTSPLIEEN